MSELWNDFLEEVASPAIAGNVVWAFFTLAIQNGINSVTAPRLLTLLVLAYYLAAEWYRSRDISKKDKHLKSNNLLIDFLLAMLIIWFSIATAEVSNVLSAVPLMLIFFVVGAGHFGKIWQPVRKGSGSVSIGYSSFVALIGLLITWEFKPMLIPCISLIALTIVIMIWTFTRKNKR